MEDPKIVVVNYHNISKLKNLFIGFVMMAKFRFYVSFFRSNFFNENLHLH